MAKYNGTLFAVLSGTNKVLYLTSCSLTLSQNLADTSNKESAGWAEHINGMRSASIPFEGVYDEAQITGSGLTAVAIADLIIDRTADTVIKWTADGGTSGFTGNGTFENITISAPMEEGVKFSGSIKFNGPVADI